MKTKSILLFGGLILSVALILNSNNVVTFADANQSMPSNVVNNVHLIVVFDFPDGSEKITTLNTFKQIQGFGELKQPIFLLQGPVDPQKHTLYEAIDYEYVRGNSNVGQNHKYSDITISVYLENGEGTLRQFTYSKCNVSNYYIDTLNDGVYSQDGSANFAFIDNIEFTCLGMKMNSTYKESTISPGMYKQIGNGKFIDMYTGKLKYMPQYNSSLTVLGNGMYMKDGGE